MLKDKVNAFYPNIYLYIQQNNATLPTLDMHGQMRINNY